MRLSYGVVQNHDASTNYKDFWAERNLKFLEAIRATEEARSSSKAFEDGQINKLSKNSKNNRKTVEAHHNINAWDLSVLVDATLFLAQIALKWLQEGLDWHFRAETDLFNLQCKILRRLWATFGAF